MQNDIFRRTFCVNNQICTVVIDGGSSGNIVAQALVDCLWIRVHKRSGPYFVHWLMKGDEVQVQHRCKVTFTIGDDYKDKMWCDVVLMDVRDVLLGRPWMNIKA